MSNHTPDELQSKNVCPAKVAFPDNTPEQADAQISALDGWQVTHNHERIRKEWVVKNFMAGMRFFNAVADLAEAEAHHPDLHITGYRNVAIEIWTARSRADCRKTTLFWPQKLTSLRLIRNRSSTGKPNRST